MTEEKNPRSRILVGTLVGVGLAALAVAAVVGIGGPTGFPFLLASAAAFTAAAVHRWRSPKRFLALTGGAAAGFVAFALLHNLFYAFGEMTSVAALDAVFEVLHAGFLLVAVAVCPVVFLVGVVGLIATLIHRRLHPV